MPLPPISQEQNEILEVVQKGHHLQIDAVAGSGKTTTCLYVAQQMREPILLLTYNARLKMETRQKVVDMGLQHMEVHSYHAFAVKYLDPKAYTDAGILAYFKKPSKKKMPKFPYHLVIVDEAQDMNPLYFRIVQHILQSCTNDPQLMVMGDRKQSIYGFNRADPRFLTLAPLVFSKNSARPWTRAPLSTSYRITEPMAALIHKGCFGALPIRSVKKGDKVRYIIANLYGARPVKEIEYYLGRGFEHQDIFVLAASVKCSKSPVRVLANRLTEKGVPIYVPTSDEEKLDEEVLHHKIVFSTFHQVKGLERAVVLVFDFSENYFKYYGKNLPTHEIPNTVYVAMTRARVGLTLFHDDTSPYFSFLDRSKLRECCTVETSKRFREDRMLSVGPRSPLKKKIPIGELIRYVPVDILHQCLQAIRVHRVTEKSHVLDLPLKSKQRDTFESVSEINSVAIPSYFEYRRTGRMTICPPTSFLLSTPSSPVEMTVEHLLRSSTKWVSQKSGYDFKNSQIQRFDWLSKDVLEEAVLRLESCFQDSVGELQLEKYVSHEDGNVELSGLVDIWDPVQEQVFEIKTVSELGPEHFIQAALSTWLLQKTGVSVKKTRLYNIMDGEEYEVSWKGDVITQDAEIRRLVLLKTTPRDSEKEDKAFLSSLTF